MSPKKRLSENKGLPERWRMKGNTYYYRVPPGLEHRWDGKTEFRLGTNLSEAYRTFTERLEVPDSVISMAEVFQRYRLEVIPTKRPATQTGDLKRMRVLEEIFGHTKAELVTTQDCFKIRDTFARKRGTRTANHFMALLSHVFTWAIEWGAISDHPMKGKVRKLKVKVNVHVPTKEDILEALTVAPPMIKAYVQLKLLTGLRQSDILQILLSNIKEDGIHVTPSKTADSSGKSIIIQWDDSLREAVENVKESSTGLSSVYLFSTRNGQPYFKAEKGEASGFGSIWQRWMKKALWETNLETRFTEKSLRTFVANEFETPEEAARLLAHADVRTTKQHYRTKPEKVFPVSSMGNKRSNGKVQNIREKKQ